MPSNLEPVQSNPVQGGPCHHIGVGAPLQKINSRASVLTDRERDKIRRERSLRRERALCLTSLPAWWQRVEKEGRQFLREVKRECTARMLKVEERRKKQHEFHQEIFPNIYKLTRWYSAFSSCKDILCYKGGRGKREGLEIRKLSCYQTSF